MNQNRVSTSWLYYLLMLVLPVFQGASTSHSYTGKNGWFSGKTLKAYDNLGRGYGFIFGSSNMGKYGTNTTAPNFLLIIGFLCIVVGLIVSIIYFQKVNSNEDIKAKKLKSLMIFLTLGIIIGFNPFNANEVVRNLLGGNNFRIKIGLWGPFVFGIIGLIIHLVTNNIYYSAVASTKSSDDLLNTKQ